jgi:hypothetical protein
MGIVWPYTHNIAAVEYLDRPVETGGRMRRRFAGTAAAP